MLSALTIGSQLQFALCRGGLRGSGLIFAAASVFAKFAHGQPVNESPASQLEQMDVRFQEAVRANDASALDAILADDFLLTTGTGRTFSKADLLSEARSGRFVYFKNETKIRRIAVREDVGVVTGLLAIQGTDWGKPFDVQLWYTDIYVRHSSGWQNWLDQASRPLATSVADAARTKPAP